MKIEYKVIAYSIIGGIILWIVGGVLDYAFFHEGSFIELLIFDNPPHLYIRVIGVLFFLIFGLIIAKLQIKHRKWEEKLKKYADHLEEFVEGRFIPLEKATELLQKAGGAGWFAYLKLDQLCDTIIDGICLIDKEYKVVKVNKSFCNLFGIRKDEVIGKNCHDVLNHTLCGPDCPVPKILKENKEFFECDIEIEKDGENKIFCIITITPFYEPSGEPVGIIENFRDITDRKQIEKLLRESEMKYSTLIEQANDSVVIIQDGIFKFVNKISTEVINYTFDELINKPFLDIVAPESKEKVAQIYKMALEGKSPPLSVAKFRCKDGTIKYGDISIGFIQYKGKPAAMAITRDITERIKTEKIIEASETKFRTVFENAGSAIFIADRETGKILDCNKLAEKLIGRPREELIGMHQSEIHPKNETEKYKAKFASHIQKGHIMDFEGEVQNKDGRRIPVYIAARSMEIEGKKIIVGFFFDVTEQKKMEEELIKVQKMEAISILAGGIAHDFNNLLTAIIGNLSLIELYAKSGKNIFEVLEETKKASHQTKYLTQQLLTFSKGGEPMKKPVSISKLLKETAGFVLSGSNVKCKLAIPDDLQMAEIDEGQITQVVNNLIINADQAMPQGGIIEVDAENVIVRPEDGLPLIAGKYIKISIKDHGIGIPDEYLSKIFDPYFSTKQKGSGLGLSITYSIIQKHKGHITVESKIGYGTTFSMYLPAIEKEVFTVQKIEEKHPIFGKGKILFMDDQKSIRNMIRQMLTHLGYDVEFASDGSQAIEMYKKAKEEGQPFDVVILDLTVPGGMGGQEAAQELVKIDPRLKAIVSSGYSNDIILSEYKRYGFMGVISKPYEVQELSETLYKVITEKEKTHFET